MVNGIIVKMSDEEEKEALDYRAEVKTAEDAIAWKRNRQAEYPAIGDQLDDLYHAGAFSDEMTATLKKVKDDNPK